MLCHAARERWPNDRVTLVGHSLGGHASIAAVATSLAEPDAIVALATNVWLPSEEPNPFLLAKKVGPPCASASRDGDAGYFPARALRFGSDDEAAPFMTNWTGWWRRDRWTSDDGVDYFAAMPALRVPVLSIASLGDHSFCTPPAPFASFSEQLAPSCASN